jgi:hypothetical protein
MRRLTYIALLGLVWSIAFAALVDGLDRLVGGRGDGMIFVYVGAYWTGLSAICLLEEVASQWG